MQRTKQQKLCLNVSRRNKKYIPIIHAVMEETNLSMADTIFQIMKEKHDEIESKKNNLELLGKCINQR